MSDAVAVQLTRQLPRTSGSFEPLVLNDRKWCAVEVGGREAPMERRVERGDRIERGAPAKSRHIAVDLIRPQVKLFQPDRAAFLDRDRQPDAAGIGRRIERVPV